MHREKLKPWLILTCNSLFLFFLNANLHASNLETKEQNPKSSFSSMKISYLQGRLGILSLGLELGIGGFAKPYFALIEYEALPLVGDFYNFLIGTKFPIVDSFSLKVASGYHIDPAIAEDKSALILSAMTVWQPFHNKSISLELLAVAFNIYPPTYSGHVFFHIPKIAFTYVMDE